MNLIKVIVENDWKTPQAPFPLLPPPTHPPKKNIEKPPLMLNDLLLAESGDRL